ncbi:MAG: isoprenylcysteine carboxylmethyltransferase family protein [Burkholderiaceae bacterium]|nr:isoprenylcysteine carboxylmethyltransferase family protein [Burkholderiaceae bacterium]
MAGAAELHPHGRAPARARPLGVVAASRADAALDRWLRVRPAALALLLTVVALALHALVLGAPASWAQSAPLGLPMLLAGAGWVAWAAWALRRAGTALRSAAAPSVLVDEGPYRLHRHPIYAGTVLAMLGLGLTIGVPLMAIAAVNFVAIVATVHIPHEEARLQRAFGGWYSDYAASVRRWI